VWGPNALERGRGNERVVRRRVANKGEERAFEYTHPQQIRPVSSWAPGCEQLDVAFWAHGQCAQKATSSSRPRTNPRCDGPPGVPGAKKRNPLSACDTSCPLRSLSVLACFGLDFSNFGAIHSRGDSIRFKVMGDRDLI
jgi:hypothetical protein